MSEFLKAETTIVVLVLVTTLVAIFARQRRLPYTVSLVVMGLLIAIPTTLSRPSSSRPRFTWILGSSARAWFRS